MSEEEKKEIEEMREFFEKEKDCMSMSLPRSFANTMDLIYEDSNNERKE